MPIRKKKRGNRSKMVPQSIKPEPIVPKKFKFHRDIVCEFKLRYYASLHNICTVNELSKDDLLAIHFPTNEVYQFLFDTDKWKQENPKKKNDGYLYDEFVLLCSDEAFNKYIYKNFPLAKKYDHYRESGCHRTEEVEMQAHQEWH